MRKRALICSSFYPPRFIGGAELIAHYQARALQSLGWDVLVFAGVMRGGKARYSLSRDTYEDVPICRVRLDPSDFASGSVNFSHRPVEQAFDALLDAYAPDVVHLHNVVGLSVGLVHRAKRKGIRTVLTLHDHWGFCYKNTLIKSGTDICTDHTRCAECLPELSDGHERRVPIRMRQDFVRMQLEQIDAFICPSHYLADAYIRAGFPADRFHVIWYGIDVARFARITKTSSPLLRFSFVGYVGKHKGIAVVLEALGLLGHEAGFVVNVVGEGEEKQVAERMVKESAWARSVRFWGRVDNARIEDVYRETDVLLLPSIWPENHPVCLTEAMASRTAVLASRIGGIPELVAHGETGYLFEAGNASELAGRMRELIRDRGRVARFGENGFRQIAENTLANRVREIVGVYHGKTPGGEGPRESERLLFACEGRRVDAECARALNWPGGEGDSRWRFVMADWLDEEQIRTAKALWVMDRMADMRSAVIGLRNHLPLVVPEGNSALKRLCVEGKCGLYYADASEAIRCLAYLAEEETIRSAMGENAYAMADRACGEEKPGGA